MVRQPVQRVPTRDTETEVAPATVTVVIPCFNYARYLPAAVESALSQLGVAVDVVVVDDASTDDSLAVARRLAAGDPRVRVIAHAANAGPVRTFNDSLPFVQGEFLVRLDADDLLTPGSLRRSVAVMRAHPGVGLVYGHPLHFSGDQLPPARTKATWWTVWKGHDWLWDRCRDGHNVITSPEVMMRTSLVERTGGQRELDHTHDMEMWLRLSAYSDVAYIHGADQAWHRDHPSSLSARKVDLYRDLVERKAAFDILFETIGRELHNASAFRDSAMRAIASDAVQYAARELDHGRNESSLIQTYIYVARQAVADLDTIPGWKSLARRIARGKRRSPLHPLSIQARASRRLKTVLRRYHWHRTGVF